MPLWQWNWNLSSRLSRTGRIGLCGGSSVSLLVIVRSREGQKFDAMKKGLDRIASKPTNDTPFILGETRGVFTAVFDQLGVRNFLQRPFHGVAVIARIDEAFRVFIVNVEQDVDFLLDNLGIAEFN
jgi:hypothetical protein